MAACGAPEDVGNLFLEIEDGQHDYYVHLFNADGTESQFDVKKEVLIGGHEQELLDDAGCADISLEISDDVGDLLLAVEAPMCFRLRDQNWYYTVNGADLGR